MEVTTPSGVAIVSAGHRHAGILPRHKTRTPNTSEAERTGDGGADRLRGPPAPRGKPRIITVDVGKHRPTQCSSRRMAAKQGRTPQGGVSSRASGAIAGPATCIMPPPTMAAAVLSRSLRHPDPPGTAKQPQPPPAPKGLRRAAPVLAMPDPEARPSGSGAAIVKP
ncbi:uncharacterized protein LOC123398082 [Hordeum vulgare subsp. vulgare]|uniref:uncharacterized protein LOC123398082 n=1 Tax=Hordeum vulgare subsp. vulgare TaxID=112509 RepID=UPI000B46927E|nr:uncharacterized protein LOC123398082 [Hordeum vulgare subsp. vulgare]